MAREPSSDAPGFVDLDAYPDVDPDSALDAEAQRTLHDRLVASPPPMLASERWSELLDSVTTGRVDPDIIDIAESATGDRSPGHEHQDPFEESGGSARTGDDGGPFAEDEPSHQGPFDVPPTFDVPPAEDDLSYDDTLDDPDWADPDETWPDTPTSRNDLPDAHEPDASIGWATGDHPGESDDVEDRFDDDGFDDGDPADGADGHLMD